METAVQTESQGWEAIAQRVWAGLDRLERQQEELNRSMRETDRRMQETDRLIKETMEETDRLIRENAEQMKETDRRMEETDRLIKETGEQMKETDRQMKKTDERIAKLSKNLGGLGNSFGALLETLIAARLWEKFADYPYNLRRVYQRVTLYDDQNRTLTDIDILLSDGAYAMAVEVKETLDREADVEHHVKRMELIEKYPPAEVKGKRLLGAMAGGGVDHDVAKLAYSKGFFVLELAGESVRLVPPPSGFTPREWQ